MNMLPANREPHQEDLPSVDIFKSVEDGWVVVVLLPEGCDVEQPRQGTPVLGVQLWRLNPGHNLATHHWDDLDVRVTYIKRPA